MGAYGRTFKFRSCQYIRKPCKPYSSMTNKYFGGVVSDKGAAEDVDADLKAVIDNTPKAVDAKMDGLRVADAITEIFNLFKRCNKYIDETMPWAWQKMKKRKIVWKQFFGI